MRVNALYMQASIDLYRGLYINQGPVGQIKNIVIIVVQIILFVLDDRLINHKTMSIKNILIQVQHYIFKI